MKDQPIKIMAISGSLRSRSVNTALLQAADGVLKNALDWIVSSGEFVHKPVAVISASPMPTGGENAMASLLLTLGMMSAKIVPGGTQEIPFVKQKLNADGMVTDPATEQALRSLLHALIQEVEAKASDREVS